MTLFLHSNAVPISKTVCYHATPGFHNVRAKQSVSLLHRSHFDNETWTFFLHSMSLQHYLYRLCAAIKTTSILSKVLLAEIIVLKMSFTSNKVDSPLSKSTTSQPPSTAAELRCMYFVHGFSQPHVYQFLLMADRRMTAMPLLMRKRNDLPN